MSTEELGRWYTLCHVDHSEAGGAHAGYRGGPYKTFEDAQGWAEYYNNLYCDMTVVEVSS